MANNAIFTYFLYTCNGVCPIKIWYMYGTFDYLTWLGICSLGQLSLPSVLKKRENSPACMHGFSCWLLDWNLGP